VTTVAPTAAEADALSTAIFVGGVEIATAVRDNSKRVGAVLVPEPTTGRTLRPIVLGLARDQLFLHDETAEIQRID
jgi:FAD:protein FMN transferase